MQKLQVKYLMYEIYDKTWKIGTLYIFPRIYLTVNGYFHELSNSRIKMAVNEELLLISQC